MIRGLFSCHPMQKTANSRCRCCEHRRAGAVPKIRGYELVNGNLHLTHSGIPCYNASTYQGKQCLFISMYSKIQFCILSMKFPSMETETK